MVMGNLSLFFFFGRKERVDTVFGEYSAKYVLCKITAMFALPSITHGLVPILSLARLPPFKVLLHDLILFLFFYTICRATPTNEDI